MTEFISQNNNCDLDLGPKIQDCKLVLDNAYTKYLREVISKSVKKR